jgi:UrcA family protein
MNTVTVSMALAIGTFAMMTASAQAAQLDKVVIDKPVVTVVGRDMAIDAPIQNAKVVAHVIPDPETLTTDSGVVLLNDYIREAARKACFDADPLVPDDGTCYRKALESAKPQVAALIAHAKSTASLASR